MRRSKSNAFNERPCSTEGKKTQDDLQTAQEKRAEQNRSDLSNFFRPDAQQKHRPRTFRLKHKKSCEAKALGDSHLIRLTLPDLKPDLLLVA